MASDMLGSGDSELRQALAEAAGTGDWTLFRVWVDENCEYGFGSVSPESRGLTADEIDAIYVCLDDPRILDDDDSGTLLLLVKSEWGRIPKPAQEHLLDRGLRVFDQFTCPASQILIAELLVENRPPADAVKALSHLVLAGNPNGWPIATHAIGKLARETGQPSVRKRCVDLLENQRLNSVEEVREEAEAALQLLDRLENETACQLEGEAGDFLRSHHWCKRVVSLSMCRDWEGLVAIFWAEIDPGSGANDTMWVIVGDIPPAYLGSVDCPSERSALLAYLWNMSEWVDRVRAEQSIDDCIPVLCRGSFKPIEPTAENAEMLSSRLEFVHTRMLPEFG